MLPIILIGVVVFFIYLFIIDFIFPIFDVVEGIYNNILDFVKTGTTEVENFISFLEDKIEDIKNLLPNFLA